MLTLCQINQAAIFSQIGSRGLLQQDRPATLEGQSCPFQIVVHTTLNDHTIERLPQKLFGALKDAKGSDLWLPLLAPLCRHPGLRVIKANQAEFSGVLRHLADDAVGMRVPHPQHSELHGHGGLLYVADLTMRAGSISRI